jgi:hypothetical protein
MKKLFLLILTALFVMPSLIKAQGCVEPAGDERLTVIGFIQPQADYRLLGQDFLGNSLNSSSFYFNRARMGATGVIPYDFSYYFMMEFSPTLGGPYIIDAFIAYKRFAPYVNASIGQFKSPFGIELLTPCHKLLVINRSMVVDNLASAFRVPGNRDLGFLLFGGTGDLSLFGSKTKNIFGYQLGIMNGSGMNVRDDNRQKDIVGRLTFHPFDFITVGANYRTGKQPPQAAGVTVDDIRSRIGFDLELKYKNFIVQGEYIKGTDEGSYTVGGGCGGETEVRIGSRQSDGFFLQGGYMTPWRIQPIIRYETFNPNMAADQIDDIQNIVTYGVNYFFNDRVRLQVNYLYKAEETARVEIPNDEILLQLQIEF